MKRYAIYEGIKNGDDFSRFIDVKTEDEALKYADAEWQHMSRHDQESRAYFDLALSEPYNEDDEDYADIPESDYTPIKSWV